MRIGSVQWRDFLRDHGVASYEWPTGARLHWYREIGEISWSDGSFSPHWRTGRVPS